MNYETRVRKIQKEHSRMSNAVKESINGSINSYFDFIEMANKAKGKIKSKLSPQYFPANVIKRAESNYFTKSHVYRDAIEIYQKTFGKEYQLSRA